MGQFTLNGVTYEELPDGNVRVVSTSGAAAQGRVFTLPQSSEKARDEARKDEDQNRQNAQFDVTQKNTTFNQYSKLRDDFNAQPDVKEYRQAIKAYASALKSDETPAGDLNLIYAFAKIMDPGSVVREGEQASVAGGDTLYGQTVARLKKELGDSGSFRPEYRNSLRRELQTRVAELNNAYNNQRQQYESFAAAQGMDPQQVLGVHDGQAFYDDIKKYWEDKGRKVLPEAKDAQGNALPNGATPPTQAQGAPSEGFSDSYLGQGISGVNEGIANTFGLPVDIMTGIMNLVPRGLNAVANTDIPEIEKPFLGSDWIKERFGETGVTRAPSADPNKQFVRRVGQSVGAASVPLVGTATSLPRLGSGLLSATAGGVGGATAQRVFPNNPLAEFAGEVAGSGLTGGGLALAARRNAQREIEAAIPTVDQLKDQAGELYRQAEARGITADPAMTQDLADRLRATLRDDGRISPTGRISEVYPKAKEAMQLADDYAGMPMNPTQMQTVRKVVADGLGSPDATERRMGRLLTDVFDEWADPQAPELSQARDISSRYLNAQKLERARELAQARSGQYSGSGLENALRTEYRALDREAIKAPGKYGDALQSAIEDVNRGTPASNFARGVGKLAPTGVVSGMGSILPGMAVGQSAGPIAGGATTAVLGTLGMAGKAAATNMGLRSADLAELIARNGGPIQQAPLIDAETQRAINAILAAQAGTYLDRQ